MPRFYPLRSTATILIPNPGLTPNLPPMKPHSYGTAPAEVLQAFL